MFWKLLKIATKFSYYTYFHLKLSPRYILMENFEVSVSALI
jgi:hypothetical protein